MKNQFAILRTIFSAVIALQLVPCSWTAIAQVAQPLVQKADLVYQGAFRMPDGNFGGSSENYAFGYSDEAIAFNPAKNSLFVKGHIYGQLVGEINIPSPVKSTDPSKLNTASVLQNFADITDGKLNTENIGNGMRIGGLLVYGNKLIASEYGYYDASGTQTKSHFVSGLNLATSGDAQGPFKVGGEVHTSFYGGHMSLIPAEWQSLFGGTALTGHCCTSIISHQSLGPAAFVFNPDDIGVKNPVPAASLVYYPIDHPTLGEYSSSVANPVFNMTTYITGIVFPAGTRSVLFFGRTGVGIPCYGIGGANGECKDPAGESKGCHAYPYKTYVWAYDANDLLLVKNGAKKPWEIRPYAHFDLEMPFASADGANIVNGATYDPATKKIYVSFDGGEAGHKAIIHVYQLAIGTAPPKRLSAPGGLRVQ